MSDPTRGNSVAPARAITVRQPWAWAIIYAGKDVENRGRREPWHTAIGETLAIHAAKGYTEDDEDCLPEVGMLAGPFSWDEKEYLDVRGAILGTVTLTGLHHSSECRLSCSRWAQPDHWHLILKDARAWSRPVPARGALGLWTLPTEAAP